MRLVIISDTHGSHLDLKLPNGDVLIHCGDFCMDGDHFLSALRFAGWFGAQPHKHKILIAGNHDLFLDHGISNVNPNESHMFLKGLAPSITYLQDSGITIENLKFWGSPVQPTFFDWAFNRRSNEIGKHWELIPDDTDVLITHGPSYGYRDKAPRVNEFGFEHTGCPQLRRKIEQVKPVLHCHGHIHMSYGVDYDDQKGTMFVNASVMNERYMLANKPVVVDIWNGIAIHVE